MAILGKDLISPGELTRVLVEYCPCSEPAAAVHDDDRQPAVGVVQTVVDVERGAVVVVVVVGATAVAAAVVAVVAVAREPAGTAPAAAGQEAH